MPENSQKSNFIVVYGTLRNTMYNNKRFPITFIKNFDLVGFKMYNLGAYPMIIHTGNDEDVVKGEVYQASQPTIEMIDRMEYGAGYSKMLVEVDENITAGVYVFEKVPKYATPITSNDYVQFCKDSQ